MKIDIQKINDIFQKYFQIKKTISISQKEKIDFFDSLGNLINSGIPITNGINIMLYQTKSKKVKFILVEILKNINKGKAVSETLSQFSNIFSQFDVSMIKMGEVTGKIGNSFELVRDREEKNHEIKSKIIGALIYPSIIITLSIIMIIGFLTFVIPKVQKMYVDARVNLPELTQSVIDISIFLQNNALFLILGIFFIIFSILQFKKHPKTKIYFDNFLLNVPIFGPLIRKKILSIFTSSLGTLLQNGVMIHEALEISKNSCENAHYEKRIDEIVIQIHEGIKLSELFGISKLQSGNEDQDFPIELASVTKIGEQTGKLPSLLLRLSIKYNKDIDTVVKGIQTAIEPIVIIIVGAIIGTMILAILLPFFNMVNVL